MKLREELEELTSEELLFRYKSTGDVEIKNELVLRYIHIVKNVAIQMRGVYNDFAQIDDIVNEGVLVLMSSLDKFDISKNVKFESFISKRIRGLVIDIARKNDWIPRSVRKISKDIDKATNILYMQLGRMPTDVEMANYMDMSVEKYQESLGKTNLMNVLSYEMLLEEMNNGKSSTQIMNLNNELIPEKYFDNLEVEKEIKNAIEKLRDNEKLVISLRYVQELNMKEIASVMGVSEPRVSQIHSNAIRKLRIYLSEKL